MNVSQKEMMILVASILTTLAETPGQRCPASMIYLAACGGEISKWEQVRDVMIVAGWVTVSKAHEVTLTANGLNIANKIEAAIARG